MILFPRHRHAPPEPSLPVRELMERMGDNSARAAAIYLRSTDPRQRALGRRGRYGGDRGRPVTGSRARQPLAPVGLPPGRARTKLPPRNGETPGGPQPPTAGHSGLSLWPLTLPRLLASAPSQLPGQAVRPGAPKVHP
jgi:hypothetical protein